MSPASGHDDAMVKRVAKALYDAPGLSVTDLRVDMLDGVIAVEGTVTSQAQRKLAQQAISAFANARNIELRVKIDQRDPGSGSDTSTVSVGAGPGSPTSVSAV